MTEQEGLWMANMQLGERLGFARMKTWSLTLCLLLIIATPGCFLARILDARHYQDYYTAGSIAFDRGHYKTAKEKYRTAHWYAQLASLGPHHEAAALYNYALCVGLLGDFDQAEKCLKQTIELDKKAGDAEKRVACMRLFELARLYQAWGRYDLSREYYEKGFALASRFNPDKVDPIGYAIVLEDYAIVLDQVDGKQGAEAARAHAQELRAANPGKNALEQIRYYPAEANRIGAGAIQDRGNN